MAPKTIAKKPELDPSIKDDESGAKGKEGGSLSDRI
jgi:hypothetical protein